MPIATEAPRVLVVDDDDVDREFVTRLLTKFGIAQSVDECSSIAAAREQLMTERYDCVLLDQNLGDGVGLDLLPDILAHRDEICPVILVTLSEDEALIVEAMRSGVTDFVAKSHLDGPLLERVIRAALRRAEEQQARREAQAHFATMAENLRREHENSLRQALEQAQSAHRAKSLFLANMSHEIRTPLNAVIGLCYLLQHTALDDRQSDLVSKIHVASKSLLSIVNDVLDLSKLEAGALRVENAPFRLDELLNDIAKFAEVQIGDRRIAFAVDLPPDIPVAVIGDAARLHQVLLNLVTNAIKFTECGEVRVDVQRLEAGAGGVGVPLRFAVRDTGIGIDPEVLKGLFQPFVQADASTSRRYGGTGLGLSIARQAVELMGGEIGATSEPGDGSEFWFEIAFEPCPVEVFLPQRDDNAAMADKGERLAGLSILLVDDSSINLEVASHVLGVEGAHVATAVDGQQALASVLANPTGFDIVLMDVQMPVLNGYDAFRSIEAILGDARPPVLALTAGAAGEGEDEGCPMDGLVSKPFEIDELVGTILATLHQHAGGPVVEDGPEVPVPGTGRVERDGVVRDLGGWVALPGIDIADARSRLPDDFQHYLGHLRRLLADGQDWSTQLASGPEALRRKMHRLKGNAGMLGARRLHGLAEAVERSLTGGAIEESERALAELDREMMELSVEVDRLHMAQAAAA